MFDEKLVDFETRFAGPKGRLLRLPGAPIYVGMKNYVGMLRSREVTDLTATERGAGGFGSTGVSNAVESVSHTAVTEEASGTGPQLLVKRMVRFCTTAHAIALTSAVPILANFRIWTQFRGSRTPPERCASSRHIVSFQRELCTRELRPFQTKTRSQHWDPYWVMFDGV